MDDEKTTSEYSESSQLPALGNDIGTAIMFDAAAFNRIEHIAKVMASSRSTIPKHLQGQPGDCMAIVMQAMNWGMNPYAVAQKTHVVSGTLGYEAQLVNAVITTMSPTKDRIHYDWFGDWTKILGKFKLRTKGTKGQDDYREWTVPDWDTKDEADLGVRVWATLKGESEPRILDLLLTQAQVRNSPLWAQDPRQQLAYLATKRWARLYTPDVLLGVYTPDELEESQPKDVTPPRTEPRAQTTTASIKDKLKGKQFGNVGKTREEIERAMMEASTEGQLNALVLDIQSLPDTQQDELRDVFKKRLWGIRQAERAADLEAIISSASRQELEAVLDEVKTKFPKILPMWEIRKMELVEADEWDQPQEGEILPTEGGE